MLITVSSYAASVELEWRVKDDSKVMQYSVTMWTESGVSITYKVGKVNSVKVDTLNQGKTYWFQVTPILIGELPGEKSNLIVYKVPDSKLTDIQVKPELRVKTK